MEHTISRFDTDLQALRSSVTAMAGLVEEQFMIAVSAVREGDLDQVAQVLADEAEVNRMHIQIDLNCHQIIAKLQPLAVDLREIIAVLHMNNDLERIGDEAKKIAKKARQLHGRELPIGIDRIDQMSQIVREMLRTATDAFVRQDADACEPLLRRDKDVDKLRDELTRDLIQAMTDAPHSVSEGLAFVFVVQSLERVGDHAKNIGEYIVTVVNGIDPRHRRSVAAGEANDAAQSDQ